MNTPRPERPPAFLHRPTTYNPQGEWIQAGTTGVSTETPTVNPSLRAGRPQRRKWLRNPLARLAPRYRRIAKLLPGWAWTSAVVIVAFVVALSVFTNNAHADTQGPLSASATTDCVDDATVGTVAWTSPGNAFSNNASSASASVDGTISHYIKCTNFGFTVPANSTINGIVVGVNRSASGTGNGGVTDSAIRVVKAGVIGTTDRSTTTVYTTSNTYEDHGTTSDLWGTTWATTDVNASNFGAAVAVTKANAAGAAITASVEHIRITVTYTLPTVGLTQAAYRVFNNSDSTSMGAFPDQTTYPLSTTSYNAIDIASADFNGDGKPDMVVLQKFNTTSFISTRMNNGDGTFGARTDFTSVGNAERLAVGDVSGDGKPDIVVVGTNSNGVFVYINSGSGTFAAPVNYAGPSNGTGTGDGGVTIADVDGDGDLDIATATTNGTTSNISIYPNNGTGTFGTRADYSLSTSDLGPIVAADFNSDGKPDLAVTNPGSTPCTVFVLLNSGTGTFPTNATYSLGTNSIGTDIVSADFNGDTKPDIAVANATNAANVAVLLNTGTGTFGTKSLYTTDNGAWSIAAADFNGDGKPDLVSGNGNSGISVLFNSGTGTFPTHTLYANGTGTVRANKLTAADFNGDSNPDLASANYDALNVAVFFNQSLPIDVGTASAAISTAATVAGDGTPFRVRMDIKVATNTAVTARLSLKLQYALLSGGSCSATSGFADVTNSTTVRYYNNTIATNGSRMVTNANDPTEGTNTPYTSSGLVRQTYQEAGATNFSNTSDITVGQDGMWDFALTTNHTLAGQHYCLRFLSNDAVTTTTAYTVYPELIMPASTFTQGAYRWLNKGSGFVNAWGGTGNDQGNAVVQTSDGGYAVGGLTDSFGAGGIDAYLAKYDSGGALSWSKTWGGTGTDLANSVVQTSDGGYAMTGMTANFGSGGNDVFLAKYDSSGTLSWSKTWGGASNESGISLVQTSDGGYAITGNTSSYGTAGDMFLAKYDSAGTLSWSKTWGGTSADNGNAVVQTSDGGYAVTGSTSSFGTAGDMFLAKYDSAGTLSWSKTWGGTSADNGMDLVQTSDGGYAVTGDTASYGSGGQDMFLAKYDSAGTLSWSKTWGGVGSDTGKSLVQTTDGGYAVTGDTANYGAGNNDLILAKYDSAGTLSWSKTWGAASGNEQGKSLVQTTDGGYAVGGFTYSYGAGGEESLLAKYDSTGAIGGCASPMCQSPSAGTASPTATTTSPTATVTSPAAGTTSPTPTVTTPTPTVTLIVVALLPYAANNTMYQHSSSQPIQLRIGIGLGGSGVAASGQSFKLQYAQRSGTCDTAFSGETYADVTTGTVVRYYDDPALTSGTAISASSYDPVDGTNTNDPQTYQEANNFTNSTSAIYVGEDGVWDFSLAISPTLAVGKSYCLRAVTSAGVVLNSYSVVPEVAYGPTMDALLAHSNWWSTTGIRMTKLLEP